MRQDIRFLILCAAALALLALAVPRPVKARALEGETGRQAFRTAVRRLKTPKAMASGVRINRHATSLASILFVDRSLFLDNDGDEALSFGDVLIAEGEMENYDTGAATGSWEGTLTITNDQTFLANISLRFRNTGVVSITGAPHLDGSRSNLFLAPIAGASGAIRIRGSAGFFNTENDDLVVVLGAG